MGGRSLPHHAGARVHPDRSHTVLRRVDDKLIHRRADLRAGQRRSIATQQLLHQRLGVGHWQAARLRCAVRQRKYRRAAVPVSSIFPPQTPQ